MPIPGIFASQITGHLWAPSGAYDSIATTTVGAGGASSIDFTSIPSTYTHLQIRGIARTTAATGIIATRIRFNTDTGSNYSRHVLYSDGAATYASATASGNLMSAFGICGTSVSSSIFGAGVIDILDYSNTSKYKTLRSLGGIDANGSGENEFYSGLWMNTNAITSISLFPDSGNFAQYSSIALYGIKGN